MQKDCRVRKLEGKVNATGQLPAQVERKRSSLVVDSRCSDHLVNCMNCMQSTWKLEEPFVIDVPKNGASIVGKYEAEVQAEVTVFLEEGVRVVLVTALRGNLRSVKKVSQGGINVLTSL